MQDTSIQQPPYSACAVARCIMNIHNTKEKIPYMGITKLMKLVFLSHGLFLGKHSIQLIDEQVEAWHYGPALRSLYGSIKRESEEGVLDFEKILAKSEDEAKTVEANAEAMGIINEVIEEYKQSTALELTDLTHKVGSPWELSVRSGELDIDNDLIQEYYATELVA